jgi:ADP-heptose:LPS heptosyltransferase
MDRLLVVNLTRMGDVVQTTPLLDGLRQRYPRAHLGLLVLGGFAAVARLIPGVDEVLVWNQDASVALLHDPRAGLAAGLGWHRGQIRALRGAGWDLVINLSHSRESAVLARLLARGEVRGIAVHEDGSRRVDNPWVRYFFCVTGNRGANHFNLVDIYRLAGGLGPGEGRALRLEAPTEARETARTRLAELPGSGPLVMLQGGASREHRRWPAQAFALTARRLHEACAARFLIVGSASESELCARMAKALDGLPHLNLAGRTSLAELAAFAAEADLLLTGDTGTLHVAAAMGTPCVGLFFAVALPWETGPWLPGCLVLQPDIGCSPCSHHVDCPHVICREQLRPGAVAAACEALLAGRGLCPAPPDGWEQDPGMLVWRTERDSTGLQDLRLLGPRPLTVEALCARAYRRLWLERLGCAGARLPDSAAALVSWLPQWTAPEAKSFARDLGELRAGLARMAALADEALEWTGLVEAELARPVPGGDALGRALEGIRAVDDGLFRLELARPVLRPLGVLLRLEREELEHDRELGELNGRMAAIYRELGQRARRMDDLCGLHEALVDGWAA